jgi:glycine cleavage system H protein
MDGFTYQNIFDTKGIEYLVIIGFLLIMIPFWIYLNRPLPQKQKVRVPGGSWMNRMNLLPGLFYSRNHTWTFMERTGLARIGVDDLLLHMTGPVRISELKSTGDKVSKGDLLARLGQGEKELRIYSPVSGEIMNLNPVFNNDPGALNDDPYGKGWFCEVRPDNWVEETRAHFIADAAREWARSEMARFRDFITRSVQARSPESGMLVLQEGGELSDHPLHSLPEGIWLDFQSAFLDPRD